MGPGVWTTTRSFTPQFQDRMAALRSALKVLVVKGKMGPVVITCEMVAAMDAGCAVSVQIWSEEMQRAGLASPDHVPMTTFAMTFGPPGYMKNRTSRVLYGLKPSFILLA
ncbi:hypothetical protein, variant [Allomyces macrogynus ATCC 38327]|uniref:Uncharacterized protein n=1 Tax=Allomyces macrogynus (strain ATCC 38327) TaxID=578462 RepID=A0A0L0T6P7_ALLM3|nr:hypothetical protein, variant [Allomyces macrogynus ATCC 38327]|eukprot:KNE70420.1 hypothetical protein, variant [Allomyces macrogynus ATCC 38327]